VRRGRVRKLGNCNDCRGGELERLERLEVTEFGRRSWRMKTSPPVASVVLAE
jgi:hypothetical protein